MFSSTSALAAASSQLGGGFDFSASDIEADDAHHLLMMIFATRLKNAGPAHGNGHVSPVVGLRPKTVTGNISAKSEAKIGDSVACVLMLEDPYPKPLSIELRVSGPSGVS